MINPIDLKNNLRQFIGTQQYHKLSLIPLLATDGVSYFAKTAQAFWLVDFVAAMTYSKLKNEVFIVVKAISKDEKVDITFDDGNNNILHQEHIEYTDLPEGEWKFYVTDNVMMIPSEY